MFFLLPIILVVVVSFFDYQTYQILIPAFYVSKLQRRLFIQCYVPHLYHYDSILSSLSGR